MVGTSVKDKTEMHFWSVLSYQHCMLSPQKQLAVSLSININIIFFTLFLNIYIYIKRLYNEAP